MHYRCLRSSPVSGKIRAPAQAIVEIPLFSLLGLCVVVGLGRSQAERLGSSGDSGDPELCLGAALCLILDSRGSIGSSLCWFEICHMPDGLACLVAWVVCGVLWVWVVLKVHGSVRAETRGIQSCGQQPLAVFRTGLV